MKLLAALAALCAVAGLAAASPAATCSCSMPESVKDGFDTETTPVYKAKVLGHLDMPQSPYSWTMMDVKVTFRGCAPKTDQIIVKSPKTAAGCGVAYKPNTMYMVTVRPAGSSTPPPGIAAHGLDVYSAVSCHFNRKWEDVPYEDQKFCFYSPVKGCDA